MCDGFFDKAKFIFNPFIASGAIGMCIDEFNGDNFDHGPLGFVGGGYMGQVQTNGRPDRDDARARRARRAGAPNGRTAVATTISARVKPGTGRPRQLLQLPRRLSRSRPDLPRPLRPAAGPDDDRFPRQRDQAEQRF